MKKLSKSYIALAVVSVLGVSVNADSLQEAFKNGKVSGEIRSMTVNASNVDSTLVGPYRNANSSAIGLQLNYSTGDYHGFKANVGFQVAHSFDIEKDDGTVSGGANQFSKENEGRITQEGSNLYIANLQYNVAQTEIKAGRQGILTPLIAVSNANPLKDTFEALSVTSKDIGNTEIKAYVIKKWLERYSTEDSGRIITYNKPTLSLYVKNTSIPSLTLEGQYLDVRDEVGNPTEAPKNITGKYSTHYLNAEYKLPVGFPLTLGGYIAGTDYKGSIRTGNTSENGKGKTSLHGAKLSGKIADTAFKLAYTKVSDDNSFTGALGHVPHFFKYNGGQMFTDNIFAGQSSVSLMVIPKLIPNVFTLFAVSSYSQTEQGKTVSGVDMDGATEIQADLRYKFNKEFSTRLQLAQVDLDSPTANDDKMSIAKLYLTYKF